MYRTSPVRCIFFCRFFKNSREKISFHRLFRRLLFVTPHALRRGDLYYESLRICTGLTECKRCDGWEPAFFRPSGEIFREKIRSRVRPKGARIHMRPRAGTEGAGGAKRGVCASAAARFACRLWSLEQRARSRGRDKKRDPETVFLGVSRGVF